MASLNLAYEFARAEILQAHFKPVPDEYLTRREDRGATVSCLCGSSLELSFGQIEECGCSRIFVAGQKVYAAPPAEDKPHDCAPARLTLSSGTVILTDYCRTCGGDL